MRSQGFDIDRRRARTLMRENDLNCRIRQKTSGASEATVSGHLPRLLEGRADVTEETGRVLRADITYIPATAGRHYLAVIIDTGPGRITGWTSDSRAG